MIKKWYTYMIELANSAYYTGITNDVHNRMKMHSAGKGSKYVRSHLPLRLVYLEEVGGRKAAARREREIKKLGRHQKLILPSQPQNLAWQKEWEYLSKLKEAIMGCGCDKKCCEPEPDTTKECDKDSCDCDEDCDKECEKDEDKE